MNEVIDMLYNEVDDNMIKYTADFETTTNEFDCRVWAWGLCEIGNFDNFKYGNSINGFIRFLESNAPLSLYFHNLKFDGEFIIDYLFRNNFNHVEDRKELKSNTFTTLISDMGLFYSIEICFYKKGKYKKCVKIYDSLKIIPFSVDVVAKSFNLPISKLEIDYKQNRKVGHLLTTEEINYLRNDVEIMARALNVLFNENLTKMTTGANALSNYKEIISEDRFNKLFPIPDYDSDIRQAYKGGFTYLNKKYKDKIVGEGIVLDVNSLYPSVMYFESLPYDEGVFFEGEYKEDKIYNLYIQCLTCSFKLKKDHVPSIQIKHNLMFCETEYLESSENPDGDLVTLCLTNVDLKLMFEQYDVSDITYHCGWKFKSAKNLFKDYIDKWIKVKIESTINGNKGMRTLAKLMLNSLYGKFALSPKVRSKIPYFDKEKDMVMYKFGEEEEREPIYLPIGIFITSYARYKTISSAQTVYDRFIYADTDSLHLEGLDIPKNLEISDTDLGAWKIENRFTRAKFIRQKSYIEEIDGNLNITCAGMPKGCYPYVTFDNFKIGATYNGKLQHHRVKGGVVLKEIDFSIKK